MIKKLLAIDGITPDKKAFNYAVELCTRIKAELNILQIIRLQNLGGFLAKAKSRNYLGCRGRHAAIAGT